MNRTIPLALAGLLALAPLGCARHRQSARYGTPPPPPNVRAESATAEEPQPIPINNRESPVVEGWSGGGN
jgi:hypothetical protein